MPENVLDLTKTDPQPKPEPARTPLTVQSNITREGTRSDLAMGLLWLLSLAIGGVLVFIGIGRLEGSALTQSVFPSLVTLVGTALGFYFGSESKSDQPSTPTSERPTPTSTTTAPVARPTPTVSITSPVDGATFNAPADIDIAIDATAAADRSVSKVELFVGGNSIGTIPHSPYRHKWSNVGEGTYSLMAIATDSAGSKGNSKEIRMSVGGDKQPEQPEQPDQPQ